MQKQSESDELNKSLKKKNSIKDLLNDSHYVENLHEPDIRAEFSALFEKLTSYLPIYNLIEIVAEIRHKQKFLINDFIDPIIEARIKDLNGFLQSASPGCKTLTKESYPEWLNALPDNSFDQIIINSPINALARISKEIPANLPAFETLTESLNSKIYEHYKKWLDFITKNEILSDVIFNAVQQMIKNILSKYDTRCDFQPYIKRIIFNKFTDYYSEDPLPAADEPDQSFYYVKQSFITFNLLLFLKLDSKPHHKLIFWHEFMNYIKKSDNPKEVKKAIEHDLFFSENSLLNLIILWDKVIDRIKLNCEELIDSLEFFDDKPSPDDAKNLLKQFDIFTSVLEKLFICVYTEDEYNHLRKKHTSEQLKNILLMEFFEDTDGNLPDNTKIRKLISNWNNRIKTQLVRVFNFQETSMLAV